ncbi:holin [Clostridium botulinum]|uniref:phage holin n=1 Tax=unclassified Clostridium TaxID=2614128 RepID=UPI00054092D0|nr:MULTISPECIES: phage holin [unclassified Clostridium]AIY80848.1 bacteriophage holin family protein [Clostridium botulinum 202F]KAI3347900.1 phage holin family protein [Clostridium botulinum]KON14650.1 holin [Clostridium botulinum]MBY6986503.1 holin [Clostridium botulinum]MBY7009147.1 holin [Clostridium botulinum]
MLDKSRFKNYGLWVSIAALIPLILKCFGIEIIQGEYQQIVQAILSILVMLGIVSNPTTDTKWFNDDKDLNDSKNVEIDNLNNK